MQRGNLQSIVLIFGKTIYQYFVIQRHIGKQDPFIESPLTRRINFNSFDVSLNLPQIQRKNFNINSHLPEI